MSLDCNPSVYVWGVEEVKYLACLGPGRNNDTLPEKSPERLNATTAAYISYL